MILELSALSHIAEKYKEKLLKEMTEYEHTSQDEAIIHIQQLTKCGQGDESARKYVLLFINRILVKIVTHEDIKNIKRIVTEEYKKLLEQKYKTYDQNSDTISYYQLIYAYMNDDDRNVLENIDIDKITGIDEFTEYMYSLTYGAAELESLMRLHLNNIEVHGTRKIMIETNKGVWKRIEGYKFAKEKEIIRVARRLLAQDNSKEDITQNSCEMESMLSNGYRVTIALQPGSKENMIFIKKFDAVSVANIDDLIKLGTISEEMKEDLSIYAKGRANVAIIGGVNTGKTTFLRGYVGLIPQSHKIGIVESDFETDWQKLYPEKDFVVLRQTDKYSMENQFIRLLRMNRNIMGIGEARGSEVEQWIESATRGSDGSFFTMHTRNVHDLINNMAWMSIKNGIQVDTRILRYRIASAIDIVIRLWHSADGNRIVDEISEIIKVNDNMDMPYKINTIYKRNLKTNKVEKVGNISQDLCEKFTYYNVNREELFKINPSYNG